MAEVSSGSALQAAGHAIDIACRLRGWAGSI